MKLLSKIIFIISLCMSLHADVKHETRLGFLSEGNLLLSFHNAKIALKTWIEDTAAKDNVKAEVLFYDTSDILYKTLKKSGLDVIVVELAYFFKNKNDILKISDNFWSLNMGDDNYAEYYLISKKSLHAKSFKDLVSKTITLEKGNNGAFIWLDKNSLIQNKKSAKKVLRETYIKKNESSAILNVFFNRSDFAVVRKRTWDIATDLNPSISKKIEIVKKSKKIHLSFIGFFRKGISKDISNIFFNHAEDLTSIENSENIMEVMKFNSVFKVKKESLETLTKYYDEYFELKKTYK